MHSRPRAVGRRGPAGRPAGPVGAAALLGLALVLSGCSSSTGDAAAPTSPATGGSTASPGAEAGGSGGKAPSRSKDAPEYATYVAMGDSYTAAPLVPATDTSNGCLRSTGNYPSLVAAALPGTKLTDVSCSGADSSSMAGAQRAGNAQQAPQLDVLGRRTALVTLGIGGNDANLFGTLVGTCSQLSQGDPTGSPCRDRLTAGGADTVGAALRAIRANVREVVADIRDRAPRAEVVVVGYPQIVPGSGTCPELPLAAGDYPFGRQVNRGLADAVQQGASGADAYIDVFAASAGHDICAKDPWINGIQTDPSRALAFHPFAAEQRAVADLVLDAI